MQPLACPPFLFPAAAREAQRRPPRKALHINTACGCTPQPFSPLPFHCSNEPTHLAQALRRLRCVLCERDLPPNDVLSPSAQPVAVPSVPLNLLPQPGGDAGNGERPNSGRSSSALSSVGERSDDSITSRDLSASPLSPCSDSKMVHQPYGVVPPSANLTSPRSQDSASAFDLPCGDFVKSNNETCCVALPSSGPGTLDLGEESSAVAAAATLAALRSTCLHPKPWRRVRGKKHVSFYSCQVCYSEWRIPKAGSRSREGRCDGEARGVSASPSS